MIHIIANPADILLYYTLLKIEIKAFTAIISLAFYVIKLKYEIFSRSVKFAKMSQKVANSQFRRVERGGQQRPRRFIVN